jgi:geranylgeranyl diphosphate synthase type I
MKLGPPEALAQAPTAIAGALREAVGRLSPAVRRVVEYHLGWADAEGNRTSEAGGKALRAALALLSAQAAGAPKASGIPGAVAVELVHNFSLLHDDVMDGDRERRHRPTAWVVFGVGAAVCAGNALLTLAYEVLLERANPQRLDALTSLLDATHALIAGQTRDLAFERRLDVSVDEYLAMSGEKTGALIGCAAAIGARLNAASPSLVDSLSEYGQSLGLAFQAVDDLLGIWGRPEVTGKPVGNDLRQRKASLPIVSALHAGGEAGGELRSLLARGELDDPAIERATKFVEAGGGRESAEAEAERQLRRALACLDRASLPARIHDELQQIAEFVTTREF